MPHADCNGQRLCCEVHGEGEPLLCIHGLSATADALGLEDAPHGANLERAEPFNAAVLDFLAAGAPA